MESHRRCLSCTVAVDKIIDPTDFDADETPDRYGVAKGALVTCASCLRELEAPAILTRCSGCGFGLVKLISPEGYRFDVAPRNHGVNMGKNGIMCGDCMVKARDSYVRAERYKLSLAHGRDYATTANIPIDLVKIVEADDA